MIKLLIGGSPCTYWSIAQKNNRETEPSGMGWELFENYLIAKEKFKPDFFLYENNKSAAQAIKDEIKKRLEVWDGTLLMPDSGARYIEINSALVSAQNRQRFYVHNCGEVGQPADRGILLKDILETGIGLNNKSYCLDANYYKGGNFSDLTRQSGKRLQVAEPIGVLANGKSRTIKAQYCHNNLTNFLNANYGASGVAIPINDIDGKSKSIRATCYKDTTKNLVANNYDKRTCVASPVRIGDIGSTAQAHRVYSCNGKSVTINAGGGGQGAKTGLYAIPCLNEKNMEHLMRPYGAKGKIVSAGTEKSPTLLAASGTGGGNAIYYAEMADGTKQPIYEVKDGRITIKGKQYPIKLADGFYIIRKLTVTECCRLQTMPDNYCRAVSATQGYRGLGNGWTAEVIIHILSNALKDVPKDEEIVVLSLYDGIGTGRYCLDKMGFTNVKYYAYEIDKFAMQVAMSNYPDIVQCGDAFQVRQPDWKLN